MSSTCPNLDEVIQRVLSAVCQQSGFTLGEAFLPNKGKASMQLSPIHVSQGNREENFFRLSGSFVFASGVCLIGRVWKSMEYEWHCDVSALQPLVYRRHQIAALFGIKACMCFPLFYNSSVVTVLCVYDRNEGAEYEARVQSVFNAANNAIQQMGANGYAVVFKKTGAPAGPVRQKVAREISLKSLDRCRGALSKDPADRTEEDIDILIKTTKSLDFFKYLSTETRKTFCINARLISFPNGHRIFPKSGALSLEIPSRYHYIVLRGSVEVKVLEKGSFKRPVGVWTFYNSDNFAESNLRLFQSPIHDDVFVQSVEDTELLCVDIKGFEADFKTLTKPLWFEEIAACFSMAILDAAEELGMCISAIKKICRRYQVQRWPHRKVQSLQRSISALEKSSVVDEILQPDMHNLVKQWLKLMVNPMYISSDLVTQDDDEDDDDDDAAGDAEPVDVAVVPPPKSKPRTAAASVSNSKKTASPAATTTTTTTTTSIKTNIMNVEPSMDLQSAAALYRPSTIPQQNYALPSPNFDMQMYYMMQMYQQQQQQQQHQQQQYQQQPQPYQPYQQQFPMMPSNLPNLSGINTFAPSLSTLPPMQSLSNPSWAPIPPHLSEQSIINDISLGKRKFPFCT